MQQYMWIRDQNDIQDFRYKRYSNLVLCVPEYWDLKECIVMSVRFCPCALNTHTQKQPLL